MKFVTEVNPRRLFWIVLIISALIVAGFGAVGINAQGFVILWKEFPSDQINTLILDRATVYKLLPKSLRSPCQFKSGDARTHHLLDLFEAKQIASCILRFGDAVGHKSE